MANLFSINMANRKPDLTSRILQNPELKKNTKAFFGGGSDPSEGGFEVDKARFFENASVASDTQMLAPAGKVSPAEILSHLKDSRIL